MRTAIADDIRMFPPINYETNENPGILYVEIVVAFHIPLSGPS